MKVNEEAEKVVEKIVGEADLSKGRSFGGD